MKEYDFLFTLRFSGRSNLPPSELQKSINDAHSSAIDQLVSVVGTDIDLTSDLEDNNAQFTKKEK